MSKVSAVIMELDVLGTQSIEHERENWSRDCTQSSPLQMYLVPRATQVYTHTHTHQ